MADLDAQLSITADASGVEAGVGRAKKSLSDLGRTASTAGRDAAAGLDGIGAGADKADARVRRATTNLQNSLQRTIAATEAGSRSTSKYFETIAQQRGADLGALRPFLDQLDAVNAKQAAANAALGAGAIQFNKYGISAKQNAAALRQVPAQLTDIIVGLQGGQAPLTVLLQQGGQLRDVFGGALPALKAIGGAALGLINPFTVSAAAVLGLVLAYEKGRKESEAFNSALILSGNAAGATVGQLQLYARNIDAITGTQAGAAAALAQFAASGAVAAGSLEQFTVAAIQFEKAGGGAVSETAKKFADLRKAPLEAVTKLNESLNFLTRDVFLQIRALEEQGRTTEAAAVAQKAFADTLSSRSSEVLANLGLIERGWRGIKGAISEAIDAAANIGRTAGPEQLLDQARRSVAGLEELQRSRQNRGLATGDLDRQLSAARSFADTQSENVRLGQRAAANQAEQANSVKSLVEFDKLREQSLTNQEKKQREIAKATELARLGGVKQSDLDKVIGGINERFKDPKGPKGRDTTRVDARAQARLDIEAIQSTAAAQVAAVTNAERILDAFRSSQLIDEAAFYQEKRRLVEENTRVQVSAIEQENARLAQEKLNTKDGLDRDREILKNKAEINKIQASAATQAVILNAQETASIRQKTAAILSARQAQEDYFAAVQKQQQRDLEGLGQGNQTRQLNSAINQIEDRFGGQRRDVDNQEAQLQAEGRLTSEARAQFTERRKLIEEFQALSIESYRAYYDQLIKKQRDFNTGVSEATRNYVDESKNVGTQIEQAFTSAFKGAEDSLVKFITTGKLDFKSLADSILADLTRIIVKQQILGPLVESLGLGKGDSGSSGIGSAVTSFLGSLFSGAPGRATGGPVSAGSLYQVNERGPELLNVGNRQFLMMGNQGGSVTPNGGAPAGKSISIVVQQSFAANTPRETLTQAAASARRQLEAGARNL